MMRKSIVGKSFVTVALLFAMCPPSTAINIDFETPPQQFSLPPELMEISGLAASPAGEIFAHDDERAIIYKLDAKTGILLGEFYLGNPVVKADFEGIAVTDDRVWLLTSSGILYESVIGKHKARVKYNRHDTGVGDFCDAEGLTTGDVQGEFLIACKQARTDALSGKLLIYKWDLSTRRSVTEPYINIPFNIFITDAYPENFKPSALEYIPKTGEIIVVSAKSGSYYNLNKNGVIIAKAKLPRVFHQKPEGLTLLPSGELMIADEGKKNTPAKLSIYLSKP